MESVYSRNISVLLVEDNADDTYLVRSLLSSAGVGRFEMDSVMRVGDALQQLNGRLYDVVLLDLTLPDATGLQSLTKVRACAPHIPVVILTGFDDNEIALRAIQNGAQDYLPKGQLTELILGRAIRHALERSDAERKLAANEEMLKLFIRHTPAAIAVLDTDLRYLQASERWIKDFHLDADIIGKHHYDVFPNLPERWKEGHRRVLAGAVERCEEDKGRTRPDGSFDWLEWEIRPWHKGSGEIGGIIFFIQIITERKQRGEEREKLVSQLQQALAEVKTLRGLVPICGNCKSVRDDSGYWDQIETYIAKHTSASFTHGLCPDCAMKELESKNIPVSESMRAAAKTNTQKKSP